jgi:plasmid stabilization system protein ParE
MKLRYKARALGDLENIYNFIAEDDPQAARSKFRER